MMSIFQKIVGLTGLFNKKTTKEPALPLSFLLKADEIDHLFRDFSQDLPYDSSTRRYYSDRNTHRPSEKDYEDGITLSLYYPEFEAYEAYINARKNHDLNGVYDYIKTTDSIRIEILSAQDTGLPTYNWVQTINNEQTGGFNVSEEDIFKQIAKFIATTSPELTIFAARYFTNIMDTPKQKAVVTTPPEARRSPV